MKRLILLLCCATPAFAQQPPIDDVLAAQYFAEAKQQSDRDAGSLWGRPLFAPMLFVDASTRYAVANAPDAGGKLQRAGDLYVGKLEDNAIIANTATNWSGTHWTMVRWPLPENVYARRKLIGHELFHRLQDSLGLPASNATNAHLALGEGRILMRLEWRALAEALMRSADERRNAIADALLFRARRHQLFINAAAEERALELNEGLAEYTGFMLSGYPASVLHDRVAVQLSNYEQMQNFARSFAYASGPAYGMLLDAAGVNWRRGMTQAADLAELLRSAHKIPVAITSNVAQRIAVYHAERMVAEERTRAAERLMVQTRLRAKLIDGPTLLLPVLDDFSYGFDPNAAIPLDEGTVYMSLTVTDEWGELNVAGGGGLIRRDERGVVTAVLVAAPVDAAQPTKGDGWTLKLRDGFVVQPAKERGSYEVVKKTP